MSDALTITVTNAGRAALVNAAKDGTNAVRIAAVGVSATAITPSAATTSLPGEIKRIATISGDAVAADTIHITVRDETNAAYAVRSIALYLSDGTLFAVYGQANVFVEKSSQAMLLLALDVRFVDITATSITFGSTDFLNPPATTDRAGVAELATDAETSAGTDDRRAVTPKGLSFALSARLAGWGNDIWRASNDGAGSGLDADLLDGQQGSWYADISGRLGYVPANRAGDAFTGRCTFGGGVTGGNGVGTGTPFLGELEIKGNGVGAAMLAFHRPNAFAAYLGVDVDNQLKFGGSSMGAISYALWHAGNDGAGSGLDADLLDGRQAADFLSKAGDTASGRLVFSAAAAGNGGVAAPTGDRGEIEVRGNGVGAAMMTFHRPGGFGMHFGLDTDNRLKVGGFTFGNEAYQIWHSGSDGAGSGLDADLLDGHDGGYYADVLARLGYVPVQQGTGIGQLPNTIKIGWSGARVKMTVDATDIGNVLFDSHVADVWRSSNDGAGSGLDADLLDGRQASDFALLSDGSRFGSNGNGYWERRPNGVIEQWGKVTGPFTESAVGISFPVPFADPNSVVVTPVAVNASANNRFDITVQRVDISANGCTLMVQYTAASSSINQIDGIDWRAVGI